jgi:hypothetical protein
MAERNPEGNFDELWWKPFLGELNRWKATRGRGRTNAYLTSRAVTRFGTLGHAWNSGCAPNLNNDISGVQWAEVADFADIVAEIKDVRSPVFTSKFCHFLLPQVFPVVDRRAMGNPFATYSSYFESVRAEWSCTSQKTRVLLRATLDELIGMAKIPTYPTTNKIVELCLIGRRQSAI